MIIIIIAGKWCGKRDDGQKIDLAKFRISSYSINHKNRRDLKGGLHSGNQNSRVAGSREHQQTNSGTGSMVLSPAYEH